MQKDLSRRLLKRLKIIEGQIRGIQRLIEGDAYCVEVLRQTSAAKQALSGVEDILLENHLKTCALHQMKSGQETTAVKELVDVYRLSKKS